MKKAFKYLSVVAATMLIGTSCDILDLEPTKEYPESIAWESESAVDMYTTGFYAVLRDNSEIYKHNLSDCYSDILKQVGWMNNGQYNHVLLDADYIKNAGAGPFEMWTETHYGRIRRHNEFLYDAPTKGSKFSDEFMNIRKAEVRFLRAYSYYLLARIYGGVVIRTEENGVDANFEKDKARATEQQTWDFIISELQAAAPALPDTWPSQWRGRVNKGAAYAFLSRMALYGKRYDIAATAAEEVYKLGYDLMPNYADIFTDLNGNPEVILAIEFGDGLTHEFDRYFRPSGDNANNYCIAVPTEELVNAYEMANGNEFSWSAFEADRDAYLNDPYSGREPRFYATILYNGASWNNRTINSTTNSGAADRTVEWQQNDYINTSVTGYYIRKYLQEGNNSYIEDKSTQYDVFIRLGEVILNHAEALAQANWSANSSKAIDLVHRVRSRGRDGLAKKSPANLEAFMSLIERERMLELAVEGHRYWDIRRWRIAERTIQNQQAHATLITELADGTLQYAHPDCDAGLSRYWTPGYYLFSIPESERNNNALLGDNNPYWSN